MTRIINVQPAEKYASKEAKAPYGRLLDLHSIFSTIQGEGPHAGKPAVFIRLAGCNLQCPQCDTDYTEGRRTTSTEAILQEVMRVSGPFSNLVVITGGEPFRQDISPLLTRLLQHGFIPQVETNGVFFPDYLPEGVDVVCSPKTPFINPKLVERLTALKYVVRAGDTNPDDGLPMGVLGLSFAKGCARPPMGFPRSWVYVQPEDNQDPIANQANLEEAISSAKRFGYTLCLQLHKLANLP